MSRYIARRLLIALPTLFIASVVTVGFREFIPDELLMARLLEGGDIFGEEAWAEFRAELGVGQSLPQRYVERVGGVLRGDFGTSWWSGRDVTAEVAARSRVSIGLLLVALPVALAMTAARGLLAVLRPGSRLDRWCARISRVGAATPEFVIAILGAYVLYALAGLEPGLKPPYGALPLEPEWQWPIAALVVGGVAAGWYVGARSAIDAGPARRDGRDHGYVLAAQATGLGDASIATRHVLPNVTVSTLRAAAAAFPFLLGSVLMVEVALRLPGVGHLALESAAYWDFPVLQGVLFAAAVTVIASRLVVDVASAAIDPRIRNDEGAAGPGYAPGWSRP